MVCEEGLIQSFDLNLRKLKAVTSPVPLTEDATPAAIDGYLYLPTRDGIRVLDLVAANFEVSVELNIVSGPAISPIGVAQDCATAVTGGSDVRLVILRHGGVAADVPIPEVAGPSFAPVVRGMHAFVASPKSSRVYVVDLTSKRVVRVADCGGPVRYSAAAQDGIALLVATNSGTQIMVVDASSNRVVVPALPVDATWLQPADAVQGWVWGDGSRMVVQGNYGVRDVRLGGNANIGLAQIDGARAIAIAQAADSSAVIAVELTTALVRRREVLGSCGYSQFVIHGNRTVASDGKGLRSVVIGETL